MSGTAKSRRAACTTAILLAAGKSRRMRGVDKLFLKLGEKPVLYYSLCAFQKSRHIDQIFVTCNPRNRNKLESLIKTHRFTKVKKLIRGGRERSDSVSLALEQIGTAKGWVVIHDGARPMINDEMIRQGLDLASRRGAAVIATKVSDTIKKAARGGRVIATVDRKHLYAVQTPQIFKLSLILKAYRYVRKRRMAVTDDGAAVEASGGRVFLYEYDGPNLKITRRQDLPLARVLLEERGN